LPPKSDAPDLWRRGGVSMSKESEGIFDDSVVYVTRQGSQVGVDGAGSPST